MRGASFAYGMGFVHGASFAYGMGFTHGTGFVHGMDALCARCHGVKSIEIDDWDLLRTHNGEQTQPRRFDGKHRQQ